MVDKKLLDEVRALERTRNLSPLIVTLMSLADRYSDQMVKLDQIIKRHEHALDVLTTRCIELTMQINKLEKP